MKGVFPQNLHRFFAIALLALACLNCLFCKNKSEKPLEAKELQNRVPNGQLTNTSNQTSTKHDTAMPTENGKIDKNLLQKIEKLPDTAVIDCLIYPARTVEDLKNLLDEKGKKSSLSYNYLPLAGCFVAQLQKKILFELEPEEAILRIMENPTFNTNE